MKDFKKNDRIIVSTQKSRAFGLHGTVVRTVPEANFVLLQLDKFPEYEELAFMTDEIDKLQ